MATHKSSEKRARQTVRRNKLNRGRRAAIQTTVKNVENAVAANDADGAKNAQLEATSALARGVRSGTVHWKTAARKTSRLARRAKKVAEKK